PTPSQPDPQWLRERDTLLKEFDEAQKAYDELVQGGKVAEAVTAGIRLQRLSERLFDLDLRLGAAKYGLSYDEVLEAARQAHDEGEITDGLSLDYWLLRQAYERVSLSDREKALAEREQALAKREQQIEEEVQRRVAEALQRSGATNIPTLAGGTPSRRQQLEQALKGAD
ncbi:MAG: hypothetical protein RMN51_13610, partial [Verrucomicrobiota bacterium]|nr:hypothetical protein [Verrucomicrobiota bacterium]